MQPAKAKATASRKAAAKMLSMDRQLKKRENTSAANPLRFGNFKLLFHERCLQPVLGTVLEQGLHRRDLYQRTGSVSAHGFERNATPRKGKISANEKNIVAQDCISSNSKEE